MCAVSGQVQVSALLPINSTTIPSHKLTHISVLWIDDGDDGRDDGNGAGDDGYHGGDVVKLK